MFDLSRGTFVLVYLLIVRIGLTKIFRSGIFRL